MGVTYIVNGKRVNPDGTPAGSGQAAAASEPQAPQPPKVEFDPAVVTDDQLERLKKAELQAVASHRGVEVDEKATNAEIVEALRKPAGDQTGNDQTGNQQTATS